MPTTASVTDVINAMENLTKVHRDYSKLWFDQIEQVTLSIGLVRKIQEDMEIQFEVRCRELEEKQCSILEVRLTYP